MFRYKIVTDPTDLSLSARIWTNSDAAADFIATRAKHYRASHDLDAAFEVNDPVEVPLFDPQAAHRALNEDLGALLGVDFGEWMKARGYGFANSLAGYRQRYSVSHAVASS